MSDARREQEEKLSRALAHGLDAGPVPPRVQARLNATYASLEAIPQERPQGGTAQAKASPHPRAAQPVRRGGRVVRRGAVVAAAAVLVVLLSGAAFAATTLLQMQPGDVPFFSGGKNLPIYGSLQEGVSSLNAEVGQTVEVDGVRVTLDTVSSDRNIVNLFFTLEKEGGFDLSQLANYEGSQENEWARLQRLAPRFTYTLTSGGEQLGMGQANLLDAYQEGGAVKVMQRIVPEVTLSDQVEIALEGWASWGAQAESGIPSIDLSVGLDLSTVAQPRELGAQDLVFPTSDGDKTLGIQRFTASELGTVMVLRNDNAWTGEPMTEGSSYGPPENVLPPERVKMTDDKGNVLNFVNAGDGTGYSPEAPVVAELSGLASDATSVTFTPMMLTDAAKAGEDPDAVEARKAMSAQNEPRSVDVSQIGAKLETSEFGGYEVVERSVADRTVTIKLKPFGWVPGGLHSMFELIPDEDVTYLASEWTNPETGETGTGYHSGVRYSKYDYLTGDLVQMDSYYAASDEELQGVTQYLYRPMFGYFAEEADAAQTLSF